MGRELKRSEAVYSHFGKIKKIEIFYKGSFLVIFLPLLVSLLNMKNEKKRFWWENLTLLL